MSYATLPPNTIGCGPCVVWRCLIALGLLLSQIACSEDPLAGGTSRTNAMRASRFFSEPTQRRLAEAVEAGNTEKIAEAIRLGGDVNKPGNEGMSMLTWAVVKESVAGFEALLDHGADLTAEVRSPRVVQAGEQPLTIIEFVCRDKNKAFFNAALKRGFNPDFVAVPQSKESLLFRAVREEDVEAAAMLLDAGADLNWQDREGITPMAQAQYINDYKMVSYFLERGADPTKKNDCDLDIAANIKQYGTRGVTPEQMPFFEKVVAELEKRGLITRQDIVNADKPKNGSGVKTIVHPPDSEMGRAIRQMDQAEQEANRRDAQQRP